MTKRPRRKFTTEFKAQMVALHESGKRRKDLINDYDLSASALDKWIKQAKTTGSFREADNLKPEQIEINEMRKKLKQLEMENDLIKQAALIFGRK
jgi:transposase